VFTYQENRVLLIEDGTLTFPCEVTATVGLIPSPVYGDAVPGQTCALGSTARSSWNANTGRTYVESLPPLPPVDVRTTADDMAVTLVGNTVRATWLSASREELTGALGALHFVLPLCLSLDFADPGLPAVTSGRAGETSFVWQVEATRGSFEAITPAMRDGRVIAALDRVPLLCDDRNVRLLAATAYFHKAVRLLVAGAGPSEFAGEAVVNLAKCLEVLFPGPPERTREAVRHGLGQLGYSDDEIERIFVKALVLRSSLDAAHVRMAILTAEERRKIQQYMEGVVVHFRRLLRDVADRVARGELELSLHDSERTPNDDLAKLLASL
jgi:hypothetical protein